MDRCPVCRKMCEDIRHVGVECFYRVNEVAPKMKEQLVLQEVHENAPYWGVTRAYPAGTRDEFSARQKTGEPNTTIIDTTQVPIPAVRLLEKTLYTIQCCKPCRGDFLELLKKWTNGEFKRKGE